MTRILHLSDPHFGAANPHAAEAFLVQAAELEPDLTVLSGDLTMRARRSEMTAAREFVNRLPAPHVLIPGNHDIPAVNQPFDRFFRPFDRFGRYFGNDLEPAVIANDFHLVSLNSTRAFGLHADWSEGRLSRRQLQRMRDRIVAAPPRDYRLLVLHHPLLAPLHHRRSVVEPLSNLLHAIAESSIDLVFCGHFHRSQLATAGIDGGWQCMVSQAPTVCSTRLQGEPQGFHVIHLDGACAAITHFVFDGSQFHEAGDTRFNRSCTGWHVETDASAR
jgi:3',5'-cyclic AMP phosphodiesterase CpdA